MAQAAAFSSVSREASNDNLFGGTSISIAGPAPSGAAIAARGRGAVRHVSVPCPVEMPSRLRPAPWTCVPAPPCVSWEDPHNEASAKPATARGGWDRRAWAVDAGHGTDRRGDRPTAARLWHRTVRQQVSGHQETKHVCVLAPHVFNSEPRCDCARIALRCPDLESVDRHSRYPGEMRSQATGSDPNFTSKLSYCGEPSEGPTPRLRPRARTCCTPPRRVRHNFPSSN